MRTKENEYCVLREKLSLHSISLSYLIGMNDFTTNSGSKWWNKMKRHSINQEKSLSSFKLKSERWLHVEIKHVSLSNTNGFRHRYRCLTEGCLRLTRLSQTMAAYFYGSFLYMQIIFQLDITLRSSSIQSVEWLL